MKQLIWIVLLGACSKSSQPPKIVTSDAVVATTTTTVDATPAPPPFVAEIPPGISPWAQCSGRWTATIAFKREPVTFNNKVQPVCSEAMLVPYAEVDVV